MFVRCPNCRFIFDAGTPGLLPACRQCGGATVAVLKIAPAPDFEVATPTRKFRPETVKLLR
jgi:hypothetical protein